MPPPLPACASEDAADGPRIASPLRNVNYALRHSAPLETIAALDALGPLIPRTSRLAGSSIHRYACCRSQRMATAPQIGGR